jgi:hypothetical protein
MFRTIPLFLVVLAACGPMPSMPDAGSTITLGNTSSSSMPAPMGGSPNVLGPCTGAEGSSCGNGRGACVSSLNLPNEKQCLALATGSSPCPRGSFGAKFREGVQVCLDLCTSIRDCSSGFFCNPTVHEDDRGTLQSVKVCTPGAVNRAGMGCDDQSDCEYAATDLVCTGRSSDAQGICTKACASDAQCHGSGTDRSAVCGSSPSRERMCFQPCTSGRCFGGQVCQNNVCVPQGQAVGTFPTPTFGQIGGECASDSACGQNRFCSTRAPGGTCSGACTSESQCGTNGTCVNLTGTSSSAFCYAKCSSPGSQSNCRAGYRCEALQGVSFGFCIMN